MLEIENIIYNTTRDIYSIEDKLSVATVFIFCCCFSPCLVSKDGWIFLRSCEYSRVVLPPTLDGLLHVVEFKNIKLENMYTAEMIIQAAITANLTTHQIDVLFKKIIEAKKLELSPQLQQPDCYMLRELLVQVLRNVRKLKQSSDIGHVIHATMLILEHHLEDSLQSIEELLIVP